MLEVFTVAAVAFADGPRVLNQFDRHINSVSFGWFGGVTTAIETGVELLIWFCPESFY